jgi:hypothetical protein
MNSIIDQQRQDSEGISKIYVVNLIHYDHYRFQQLIGVSMSLRGCMQIIETYKIKHPNHEYVDFVRYDDDDGPEDYSMRSDDITHFQLKEVALTT